MPLLWMIRPRSLSSSHLARSSFHQARISLTEKGREALSRMGREYLAQAKRLDPTIDISRVDDR
jgi:hypothetical protein